VGRSPLFTEVIRALRIARFCNDHRLSTLEGLERFRAAEIEQAAAGCSRREWLKTVARACAVGTAASIATPVSRLFATGQPASSLDVGIVGAGIAGLACADTLASGGGSATGLEPDQQSCLNFLLFIHADRRSKFTPFEVFSDERYHLVDGNDRIVEGLTRALLRPVESNMMLTAVRQTSGGRLELTFETHGRVVSRIHDAVVLAIPFTTLRDVDLDLNLDLSPEKRAAIDLLGYGTNAKMMVGFESQAWIAHGGNGSSYSDLANHQATWETNAQRATSTRAVLTDYSGGNRGASLNPGATQLEADLFLADLDLVFPGAQAAARRTKGNVVAHLEHWPSNPLTRGSYTCYLPGQFTTIAGLEGMPGHNLYFAGEHANSFYEWQGFMEGAALSGIDVAMAILRPRDADQRRARRPLRLASTA
jgi:monoamine oxidase